jgi:uncharacterized coiled-coil protein SlyX
MSAEAAQRLEDKVDELRRDIKRLAEKLKLLMDELGVKETPKH